MNPFTGSPPIVNTLLSHFQDCCNHSTQTVISLSRYNKVFNTSTVELLLTKFTTNWQITLNIGLARTTPENTSIVFKRHISLCIIVFIRHTMSLDVSAHKAIIRQYINRSYTIELCLLYEFMY
jgi:hypothetical protein